MWPVRNKTIIGLKCYCPKAIKQDILELEIRL